MIYNMFIKMIFGWEVDLFEMVLNESISDYLVNN